MVEAKERGPDEVDSGRDGAVAAIARRLDGLPLTRLHWAILAVSTLGVFTDIAEIALSNALAAIFLAPPPICRGAACPCCWPPCSPAERWARRSSDCWATASDAGARSRPPWH
ncbi:hypothetical protein MKK75_06240 [Methylobacterium sp. J-030]|uniref:hypothetical protein n=1 Tax=Methylobacterium sp. J-030 TaxID=2836627 RepID=UPI001FBA6BC6|nr:hypothetical protein [Methylobacterium sp. J-030]MCJ2068412.1 hypothetical protein [Methylobacterium sp. J-030]